jgi:ferredoxin
VTVIHSQYRESGTVAIDETICTHCGACARICPAEVLSLDGERVEIAVTSPFGCIACGHCMMVCPGGAITVTGRGISPQDLVPLSEPPGRAGADALAALLQARRSVRRFRDEPIAPELIARVVEMAATAPMGIPPSDVGCVIVHGREEVARVADAVVDGYEGFLRIFKPWLIAAMRPFVGQAKHDWFASFLLPLARTYVEGRAASRDLLFYDAPALLIFHHSPYADPLDAGIACTYAMLAAESLGLGSTMIGGAPPILQRNKALSRRLAIPAGNTPTIALILGHPAVSFRRAIRRRFAHVSTIGEVRSEISRK